jgi:hypothetical protein
VKGVSIGEYGKILEPMSLAYYKVTKKVSKRHQENFSNPINHIGFGDRKLKQTSLFILMWVCVTAYQCEGKLNLCVGLQVLNTVHDSAGCKTIRLSDSTNLV